MHVTFVDITTQTIILQGDGEPQLNDIVVLPNGVAYRVVQRLIMLHEASNIVSIANATAPSGQKKLESEMQVALQPIEIPDAGDPNAIKQ